VVARVAQNLKSTASTGRAEEKSTKIITEILAKLTLELIQLAKNSVKLIIDTFSNALRTSFCCSRNKASTVSN